MLCGEVLGLISLCTLSLLMHTVTQLAVRALRSSSYRRWVPPPSPAAQQGQSSTGQPPGDGHCGFTRPVQRQDPSPPWEGRPGSHGAAGEIPSPLIRQRN